MEILKFGNASSQALYLGTSGSHLAVFSEDVTFAHHFVAPCLPPTLLKWWAIQLAIQCTADTVLLP